MCGKGGGDTTQTTVTQLPPAMQAAYNSLIGQAQGIYNSTSYTPFGGGTTNPTIQSGTQALQNAQGAYQPYFNSASSALTQAGTPAYQSVQNYENPYQQDVINATLANMNQQNQQQQQGVIGNAVLSGAMGGDRVGVAQAQLAGQQALANNQTLAQLNSQNYSQALGAAQQQQQNELGIAGTQAGMGNSASQNLTQSGMATTQAGEDQYNRDLAQYQAQQSYPFQKASWLGNIVEGLGSTSGGTSTTTSNADTGNTGSSIFGGILGLASIIPKLATGGVVPYGGLQPVGGTQAGAANPDFSGGVIPNMGGMGMGSGPRAAPAPSPSASQPDALSKFSDTLQQKAMSQGLDNIKTGIQNAVTPPAPDVANMTTPTSAPEGTGSAGGGGLLGALGNMFHFARGGNVRGYDDGGIVDGTQVFDPAIGWIPADDLSGSDAALGAVNLAPVPTSLDAAPSGSNASASVVPAAPIPAAGPASTNAAAPNASNAGVVAAAAPVAAPQSQGVVGASASTPSGGIVPPMPAAQWVAAAPKVKSASQLQQNLIQYANNKDAQYGLPAGTLWGIALPESGGDPGAHNRSGAAGIMQIMPATGASLGVQNPYDPYQAIDAAGRLAQQNQAYLRNSLGRDPTAPEIYLSHNQGMGGATKLLLNPNASAASLVGEASVVQNGGDPSWTAGQFANFIESKFGKGGGGGGGNADVTGSIGGSGVVPATSAANAAATPATSSNGVAPASADSGGILGRIFSGQGLTDNERLALLSAGLAIMGGKSRNPMINIGQGGLAGVQMYGTLQDRDRANALAQSEIATRQGDLGLKGKSIDLAAQQLHQQAQQFEQTYGLEANEQQMKRYQVIPTMRGMLVRDSLNPTQPPQIVPYAGTSSQGVAPQAGPPQAASPASPPTSGGILTPRQAQSPADAGQQAPTSQVSGTDTTAQQAAAAPSVNSNRTGAPLSNKQPARANAPASTGILSASAPGSVASSTAQRPPVSPASMPKISLQPPTPDASQIPWNGMAFNEAGQKALVDQTADALKTARSDATAAQAMNQQLQEMQQDIQGLPRNGMLSLGSGFDGRTAFAKGVNSYMQAAHMDPIWDPDEVARTEDLKKDSTRLGFDLSRMLGSREAGFITNEALAAVPGGANSVRDAQIIMASLQAANQRKVDYYNFIQDWSSRTGGDISGADNYFNTKTPPELYALGAFVPARAMTALRQGQVTPAQFEQKYGAGTSQYVLGAQQ